MDLLKVLNASISVGRAPDSYYRVMYLSDTRLSVILRPLVRPQYGELATFLVWKDQAYSTTGNFMSVSVTVNFDAL
jgi:hypothetical protein